MTTQESKKQYIIDTATELFNQHNYDAVSMSTIAAQVGITKAALYYHFQSKHDLFYHCIDTTTNAFLQKIESIIATASDSLEAQLTAINQVHIAFILGNHGFMNYLHHKAETHDSDSILDLVYQKRKKAVTVMEPLLQKIIAARTLQDIITPQDMSAAILGLTKGLLCQAQMNQSAEDPHALAKKITTLILA